MHTSRLTLFGNTVCIPRRACREHRLVVNAVIETARTPFLSSTRHLPIHAITADGLPPGLTQDQIPKHVAIITDGNSRWASIRGQPTAMGHQAGLESLKMCIECCCKWGVQALTLYGFSMENWGRERSEVNSLMWLFEGALRDMEGQLVEQGIRLRVIGDLGMLPPSLQDMVHRVHTSTESCAALHLTVALSYGSRQDIVAAAQKVADLAARGIIQPHEVDEVMLQGLLGTGEVVAAVGEPDLLIRTSGEQRLSNFLLWELAYTELVFTPAMWPEFGREAFGEALVAFAHRSRRFGRR